MAKRVVAVVDGNSLLHRAFHALPPTMTAPDGRPTNAVFGFISMLLKLADQCGPDAVVVAFDKGRPAFRTEALERYKVHRPPTPDDLRPQFEMVRELLEAMNVPVISVDGWEGDDILGTVAAHAAPAHQVLLVTGDKDALQLVNEDVRVVTTRKGITDIVLYDSAGVLERLGVRPDQVTDYLGLKGDTSDNIPGVPGIGEKTAAKLIAQYGSMDEVLAHADEVPGRVGENLREHADQARVSREVATIRTDVPIELDLDAVRWGDIDADAVVRAFGAFRFVSLTEKVLALGRRRCAAAPAAPGRASTPGVAIEEVAAALGCAVEEPAGRDAWPAAPAKDARASVDAAIAASELIGVAAEGAGETLFPSREMAFAIPSGARVAVLDGPEAEGALLEALSRARVAAPELKSLLQRVSPPGEGGPIAAYADAIDPARCDDAGVAAYLLESNRSSYDVRGLYRDLLGVDLPECAGEHARVGADAQAAAELAPVLRERLVAIGSLDVYERCEIALIPVLARMEDVGLGLDTSVLASLSVEVAADAGRLTHEIHELAGVEFNIDSPKQLGEVLFEKLGLPTGKRTKTGWSTDAQVLGSLAVSYPICAKVLEYRELAKLRSTYIDALPRLVGPDGRVHTTFNQTVAATGRLSSSNPNLQNIPVRTDLGRRIRAAFVPARGGDLIMSADYSQIELRILAHLSGDPGLIEAFTCGEDFHTATGARVFGVAPDALTPEQRRRAKAVNFGIVYGQTAHGLSESLGIGRAEAQQMIDAYFAAYPKVREFLDRTVAQAHVDGFAVTMFGRRRPIPELASSNHNLRAFGERTAMNHPMQGAAADIMKLAMIAVDRRLRADGFEARMVLQVHDELVFEVAPGEVERLAEMVRAEMDGAAALVVPIEAHVSWGEDWASAK